MKYLLPILVLIAASVSSCNKGGDTPDPDPITSTRRWVVGNDTFSVNNYTRSLDTWYAYDGNNNNISFAFNSFPTSDGNYLVVDDFAGVGPGQVSIGTFGPKIIPNRFATGNSHTMIKVRVIDSVLKITLPEMWAKDASGDSVKFSADLNPFR
jgi:hypothetical protein